MCICIVKLYTCTVNNKIVQNLGRRQLSELYVMIFCWFESDQISFIFVFFVSDCGNESKTRGNKNQPPLKIFQPKETFNNN